MARYLFSESSPRRPEARGLYEQYTPLENDPRRERFAFARACAMRRWRWLRDRIPPHDWDQTVSLAVCGWEEIGVGLARRVDNEFYALARAECFCRPSRNLRRGGTGKWRSAEDELISRLDQPEPTSPEGLYNTIIDRRIEC